MRSFELMFWFSTTLIQEPTIRTCGRVYHNDDHLRLRDRKDRHGGLSLRNVLFTPAVLSRNAVGGIRPGPVPT